MTWVTFILSCTKARTRALYLFHSSRAVHKATCVLTTKTDVCYITNHKPSIKQLKCQNKCSTLLKPDNKGERKNPNLCSFNYNEEGEQTPRSRALLEKLPVGQPTMETEGILPFPQENITGPYPDMKKEDLRISWRRI
jgi:hypothetical protein